MTAYGIEHIMPPLKEGNLAPMRAAFPEVPTDGLTTAAREVSLLVGQDNFGLFPLEWRRVCNATIYWSRFRTGWIASGRPPRQEGGGGDRHVGVSIAMRSGHEQKELAGRPKRSCGLPESPACDDTWATMADVMPSQTASEQGEAEACKSPLPWEEGHDGRRGQPAEPRV